jgi:hypothetical protein
MKHLKIDFRKENFLYRLSLSLSSFLLSSLSLSLKIYARKEKNPRDEKASKIYIAQLRKGSVKCQ